MNYFDDQNVKLDVLKRKAFNFRWAEVPEGVIPLTAADPDYPCAPVIQEALLAYVKEGYFSYTPKMGDEAFKEAFVKAVKTRKNEVIDPSLVLPIDSAARGMNIIARAFLKEGDEMIVFDPCDYLFREAALSARATPVSLPVSLDRTNRKMDLSKLEEVITPKTKMLGLCNPHNPYGLLYSEEDLEYIMSICEKYDLLIMNDEIWSDIVYPDETFRSIYSLGNDRCNRVLSVFGFSKSFGLAGLRIGCIYNTDEEKFKKIVEASEVMSTVGGASSLSQVAATAAMNEAYPWVDEFIQHLTKNRDFAVEYIQKEIPDLVAYKPQGTYLLYVDVSKLTNNASEFTEFLQKDVKLALVPGGHQFFGDLSEGNIRICIATSKEILEEGLLRLKQGVEHYKQLT